MGYWLNKTFSNCSVVTCISALNEASESITDKVNRTINHAFISNIQIVYPNLHVFITQARKSHWQDL